MNEIGDGYLKWILAAGSIAVLGSFFSFSFIKVKKLVVKMFDSLDS